MAFGGSSASSSVKQAKEAVAQGALLLDVRTDAEFAEGHVSGAQNISVQILPQHLVDLSKNHKRVVVYCRSGGRSAQAASLLRSVGIEVLDIRPMSAWG